MTRKHKTIRSTEKQTYKLKCRSLQLLISHDGHGSPRQGNQEEVFTSKGKTLQSINSDRIQYINKLQQRKKVEVYSLPVKIVFIFRLGVFVKLQFHLHSVLMSENSSNIGKSSATHLLLFIEKIYVLKARWKQPWYNSQAKVNTMNVSV